MGSSNIKKLDGLSRSWHSASRVFSPPDSELTFLSISSAVNKKDPRILRSFFLISPSATWSTVSNTVLFFNSEITYGLSVFFDTSQYVAFLRFLVQKNENTINFPDHRKTRK